MFDPSKYGPLINDIRRKYDEDWHWYVEVKLSDKDKKNKELASYLVKKVDPRALEYFDPEVVNKKEILTEALSTPYGKYVYYNAVQKLNDENKNNWEYALMALKNDSGKSKYVVSEHTAILAVSDELKNNEEFMHEAVKTNCAVLKDIRDHKLYKKLSNDKEAICASIGNHPEMLEYVSNRLKNDKEVVLKAVRKDPMCIQFASKEMKNDRHIAMEAISRNAESYQYFSDEIRNDIEMALDAVSGKPEMLKFAPKTEEVVLEAVKTKPEILDDVYIATEESLYMHSNLHDCTELYGVSEEMKDKVMKKYNKLVKKGKIIPVKRNNYYDDFNIDYKVEPDMDVSYDVEDGPAKEENIDVEYDITKEDVPEEEDNITFERS